MSDNKSKIAFKENEEQIDKALSEGVVDGSDIAFTKDGRMFFIDPTTKEKIPMNKSDDELSQEILDNIDSLEATEQEIDALFNN